MNMTDLIGKTVTVTEIVFKGQSHVHHKQIGEVVAVDGSMVAVNVTTLTIGGYAQNLYTLPQVTWFNTRADTFSGIAENNT